MDETALSTNKQMTKFDIATKKVKVNLGSLFKLTMIDPNPQCYIQSFREIGPLVPKKKLLTVYGRDDYPGHVTSIMLTKFHFHEL